MGSIYRNCHFNIAATAASDNGVDLFVSRNPLFFLSIYVQIDTSFLTDNQEEMEFPQGGATQAINPAITQFIQHPMITFGSNEVGIP